MGKTGLVYDPRYLDHDMGAGHPESPNRLRAIMQQLEQSGTAARLTQDSNHARPKMNGLRRSIQPHILRC